MVELVSSVAFQMALLLFVSLAGYLIAMRINQSAVVGIIFVGILVGPSLLGLITYTSFVESLAELGAVVLLFVIGLEFKLEDILKWKYFVIALAGVVVPWIGGYGLAKLFGFSFGGAVLIGAALTATSIAITANVLKEMKKLQTPIAKTIIATAVIDDVLALLALSLSINLVSGTLQTGEILLIIGKALAFLVLGTLVGYFIVGRIVIKLDRTKMAQKYPEFVFIFALMFAFGYALISQLIGLSSIVGAFIAGVSLEGLHLRNSKSYKEGAEYLYIVFASVFFVSLGILADFHALTWFVILFLVVLSVVAILTKLIGCGISAWLLGITKKDALTVGFGMAPRGEVAMIVALIGLTHKFIGQDIYVAIVLMGLLTTIITPLVFRNWLFTSEKKFDLKIKKN